MKIVGCDLHTRYQQIAMLDQETGELIECKKGKDQMFKWILLGGWALLFVGAFLVVMFPNAAWNHEAASILWVFSIALAICTFGFCLLAAIRLIGRLVRPLTRSHVGEAQRLTTHSGSPQSRRCVLGSLAVLAIAAFVALLLAFVEYKIKSSPVYQTSVTKAHASSEVIAILGQPIHEGWFISGDLTQSSNGAGHARLTIPLSGPKGKGTLQVEAQRVAGSWRFSTLQFVASGRASTVLLGGAPSSHPSSGR